MVGSSGSATCSQPATCSGDQHHRNLASTTARSRGLRPACTAWGGPPAGRRPRQHAGPDSGGGRRCGPAPATPLTLPVPAGGRSSGRSHRRRYPGLVSSRSAAESERAARWGGRCCTRRSATQGPAPRARACPSDGRSAAATRLAATAGRIENSRVAVYLVSSAARGHAAVDRALDLPRWWTDDDDDRCRAAGIPDGLGLAAKPVLAAGWSPVLWTRARPPAGCSARRAAPSVAASTGTRPPTLGRSTHRRASGHGRSTRWPPATPASGSGEAGSRCTAW
jgi:hypothetical protein